HVNAQAVRLTTSASEMDRVAARKRGRVEQGYGDASGVEVAQSGHQPHVVLFRRQQDEVNVLAKLRRAVKQAGLPAHKQRLYLMFLHRRKDLSDRGRDQGCLPWQDTGRRVSRFAESVRWESAPATPAIHRASLRTSCSESTRAVDEANSNYMQLQQPT